MAKPMSKLALIKYAIKNKYEVNFFYAGVKVKDPAQPQYTKQGWRTVQPVAMGLSGAGNGKIMLRAWQKNGVTNTDRPAWKTFLIDELKSVTVLDGENGKYYKPFEKPDGPNYNDNGDEKFWKGKADIKIDLTIPPGPNKGTPKVIPKPASKTAEKPTTPPNPSAKAKKMPPKKEKTTTAAAKPKKMPPKMNATDPKKPVDKPAVTKGMKDPIRKPEEDNKIDASIIKTKKGGNPNNQPKKMPPKNKTQPLAQPGPEEELPPLKESKLSWLEWLQKITTNER